MNEYLKLVEKTLSADVEIDWTKPEIGANPLFMAWSYQMAITKTLIEAHQKKVVKFWTTGATGNDNPRKT